MTIPPTTEVTAALNSIVPVSMAREMSSWAVTGLFTTSTSAVAVRVTAPVVEATGAFAMIPPVSVLREMLPWAVTALLTVRPVSAVMMIVPLTLVTAEERTTVVPASKEMSPLVLTN